MRGVKIFQESIIKLSFSCLLFLSALVLFGQEQGVNRSDRIADCFGAVALPNNGSFSIAFPEEPGVYLDLDNFKKTTHTIPQQNSVWLKFEPGFEGSLSLSINLPESDCHLVVFDVAKEKACETILKAETTMLLDTLVKAGSLNLENKPYFDRKDPNSMLYIYFNYATKHRKKIHIESRFQASNFEAAKSSLMEEVDQRFDKTMPTYRLSFRDLETGLPVTTRAIIKDSRMFDAMYNGTDLLFSLDRAPKFSLRLDAIGYFPKDTSLRVEKIEETQHEIFLEPVAPGKQLSLEGIEFQPESANFVEGAHKKLTRIRDFLALNADLNIEVQGHVHQLGDDTFRSKRLSRLRAKAVADYLINSGISKDRIEYEGYGNTAMIFPEPKNDAEMQANRRVEIHIK